MHLRSTAGDCLAEVSVKIVGILGVKKKKKSLNIPIVLCTFSFCYECIRIQVTVQWIHPSPSPKPLRVTQKVPEPPLRLNSSRVLPTTASNQGKVEAPEQEFPNLLKMPLAGNVYQAPKPQGKLCMSSWWCYTDKFPPGFHQVPRGFHKKAPEKPPMTMA